MLLCKSSFCALGNHIGLISRVSLPGRKERGLWGTLLIFHIPDFSPSSFSKFQIFHTPFHIPDFPYSLFSTFQVFRGPYFSHPPFSTFRIFRTPHIPQFTFFTLLFIFVHTFQSSLRGSHFSFPHSHSSHFSHSRNIRFDFPHSLFVVSH